MTSTLDIYQKQLDELNSILAPNKCFNKIDPLIKSYQSIKRRYSTAWNSHHQHYDAKIRSFISKSPRNSKKSLPISIKDIQAFITKMKKLQLSLSEWIQSVSDINNKKNNKNAVVNTSKHIKPSKAKKRRSQSLSKKKKKKKKTVIEIIEPIPVSQIPLTLSHDISINTPIKNPIFTPIKNDIKFYKNDENENENEDENDEYPDISNIDYKQIVKSMVLTDLAPVQSISRETSARTFGELWSHQFQVDVANNYKQVVNKGFFIQNKSNRNNSTDQKMDELGDSNIFKFEVTSKQKNIVQYYHDNYYGTNEVFESAFGIRPVIYCDWTASGKVLECVERYLSKEMYTLYANTHTTTSITGIQTSKFRSEARTIILESLSGNVDEDVVIFTGSGVTGAIYKMSRILMQSIGKSYKPETTLVFISIYEHNSNIFIWKELGCKVIIIPEDIQNGGLDLKYLEKKLKYYSLSHMKNKYNLLIGSFTAASNVSGIIAPVDKTTKLLHTYGALAFWDYATAGPYLNINMTNNQNQMLSKDAVFISTHKYLAGPGAPGILCVKKKLCSNYVPVVPGGGTVFAAYGIEDGQWDYLNNIEEREEGGTPDIIGSVRAAFAFMIKDHLSTHYIEETEKKYLNYFLSEIKGLNNLIIMGNIECERLPVLSFLIQHSKKKGFGATSTKYLHYNFIAALFNDLFGIQGRGGCACAGMYGLKALGMKDDELEHIFMQMRNDKNEIARPGYFRINLHYTLTQNELKYIVDAVKYICNNGWKFLPLYDVNKETGNYFHRDIKKKPNLLKKQLRSLLDISFNDENGKMEWIQKHMRVEGKALNENFDKFFILADEILDNLKEYLPSKHEFISENDINDENAWYWLPSELYHDVLKI